MLQPAAGWRSWAAPVDAADRPGRCRCGPTARLRAGSATAVGDDPDDPARQQAAVAAVEEALAALLPVDEEGLLVNAIVEYVEGDPRSSGSARSARSSRSPSAPSSGSPPGGSG